jgi:hypothetical protein
VFAPSLFGARVIPGGAKRREGDPDLAAFGQGQPKKAWVPFPARCAGRRE